MGYRANYYVENEGDSLEGGSKKRELRVSFSFGNEVSRVDLGKVIARIRDGNNIGEGLYDYLTSAGGEALEYQSTPSRKAVKFTDSNRSVRVYLGKWKMLSFAVEVTARKDIPLERLLNCDALNKFILTGKV